MINARSILKSVLPVVRKVRATKRRGRVVALFAAVLLATTVAFSTSASAKLAGGMLPGSPLLFGASLASLLPGASSAPSNSGDVAEEPPTIVTDKSAYGPGETITFTGSNWTPGETVHILVRAGAGEGEGRTLEATADEKGSFAVTAAMPGLEEGEAAAKAQSAAAGKAHEGASAKSSAARTSDAASAASAQSRHDDRQRARRRQRGDRRGHGRPHLQQDGRLPRQADGDGRLHAWGTVNNQSGFEFLIAAVDGQLTGGGRADKFRIRIWRKSDGAVIYDNLMGGAFNASAVTTTANGDIAIKVKAA